MPSVRPTIEYKVDAETLPAVEDKFTDLQSLLDDVEALQAQIERAFNQSDLRTFLHGFLHNPDQDLALEWEGATAIIKLQPRS